MGEMEAEVEEERHLLDYDGEEIMQDSDDELYSEEIHPDGQWH